MREDVIALHGSMGTGASTFRTVSEAVSQAEPQELARTLGDLSLEQKEKLLQALGATADASAGAATELDHASAEAVATPELEPGLAACVAKEQTAAAELKPSAFGRAWLGAARCRGRARREH